MVIKRTDPIAPALLVGLSTISFLGPTVALFLVIISWVGLTAIFTIVAVSEVKRRDQAWEHYSVQLPAIEYGKGVVAGDPEAPYGIVWKPDAE